MCFRMKLRRLNCSPKPATGGLGSDNPQIEAKKKGYKAYLLFLVQIHGVKHFKIANDIDKDYFDNYLLAKKAGVKFLAYRCKINKKEIRIEKKLKIINQ